MSSIKYAVIAAAGLGSRLGRGKPKCLVAFNGITILEHLLHLVKNVENVRIVVGFMECQVIAEAKRLRSDIIIVRNPDYRNTTTLHSYALGIAYVQNSDCLFMDADLLVTPDTFQHFLSTCNPQEPRLAITMSKTKEAVFIDLNADNKVTDFHRNKKTKFEWANISWLPTNIFTKHKIQNNMNVYNYLSNLLPIATTQLNAYEIDTEEDVLNAQKQINEIISLQIANKNITSSN